MIYFREIFLKENLKRDMQNNTLAKKFTTGSILKFVLPNILMMVFLSLYTIVDGIFISRTTGEVALSATNMFYPVTCFQLGLGIMFSTGSSALIAIEMGRGEKLKAKQNFTLITIVAFVVGVVIATFCLAHLEEILLMLGTSEIQMPYALAYDSCLLYFAPAMFLEVLFQMFFVTAGKPHLGLGVTALSGITNMVLDYVLMAVLDMGTFGAALATGIGYSIPAVFGLVYFTFNRKGTLHFVKVPLCSNPEEREQHRCVKERCSFLARACLNGSSEMVSNVSVAVTTFLFNVISMKFWAENGVAAITMMSYFQFVFSAIFMGFAMGLAPVISFKYGADDKEQLRKVTKFGFTFIVIASICTYTLSRLLLPIVLEIFTDKGSAVYDIAYGGFGIYALQFLFMGISIFSSALFTALGNGKISAVISSARTLLFLVSCQLILPLVFGEVGVWWAVPVAEILGVIVSVSFVMWGRKVVQR